MSDRRLRLREVLELLGVSRWTLHRLRDAGEFPEPVYLNGNPRLMRWEEAKVLEWRAAHERAHPAAPRPARSEAKA